MAIASFVISLLSLGFALFSYFRHDAKIKRQSELLNTFQLEKIIKEKEAEKKATVEANVIKHDKGRRTIKVYNKGKATAKNVSINFPGNPNVIIGDNPSPVDLKPSHSIDISVNIFHGSDDRLRIVLTWKDLISDNNVDEQILLL